MHDLLKFWFELTRDWGYVGVFILMACESSILPLPSEVVIPPAAFWAAQGRLSFGGVLAAAIAGSYAGSLLSYWLARAIGLGWIPRFGKYLLLDEKKIIFASRWAEHYGVWGVFFARLLPGVRHLISLPAGFLRMDLAKFSGSTLVGASIWCWVLAVFGQKVLGAHPELLNSPTEMLLAVKHEMLPVFLLVAGLMAAMLVLRRMRV